MIFKKPLKCNLLFANLGHVGDKLLLLVTGVDAAHLAVRQPHAHVSASNSCSSRTRMITGSEPGENPDPNLQEYLEFLFNKNCKTFDGFNI